MNVNGIKISDKSDGLSPTLADVLEEVHAGEIYCWSILSVDGVLNHGYDAIEIGIDAKINEPENGMVVDWDQLVLFSGVFHQIWEITVLGSKDPKYLQYVGHEKAIYTACDFVLDFIDCAHWEIFSKDASFLRRLKNKFENVQPLGP